MAENSPLGWSLEFVDFGAIRKSLQGLSPQQFATFLDNFRDDVAVFGLNIFSGEKAKWLGGGLAEYRHRSNPDVLIRAFFFIHREQVFVVLSAYNKKRDPSARRQALEIQKARKLQRQTLRDL